MKKTRFFALCISMLALMASCQKESGNEEDDDFEITLELSTRSLQFSYEGGSEDITVTANEEGWTCSVIEGDEAWAHISPEGKLIHLVVDENPNQEVRSTVLTVKLQDVAKRVRIEQAAAPAPEDLPKVFAVPGLEDFAQSRVLKVMYDGNQVAEICREYLCGAGINNQAIVVYPMVGTVADISRGLAVCILDQQMEENMPTDTYTVKEGNVHCGRVCFDSSSMLLDSYSAGTEAVPSYLTISREGNLKVVESSDGFDVASIEPFTCKDASENTYGVVKIGAQYWMQSDLVTSKTRDGKELLVDISDADLWATEPAYRTSCLPELAKLYNAVACGYKDGSFSDNISPEGFTIPSNEQWSALVSYLSSETSIDVGTKLKSTGFETWLTWWNYPTGGYNISGFSANGVGYGNGDGTLAPDGNLSHVFYLSSSTYAEGLGRFNVNASDASFLLQAEGGHALGYAIRSIRR